MTPFQLYAYNTLLQIYRSGCTPQLIIDMVMPVSWIDAMWLKYGNDNMEHAPCA